MRLPPICVPCRQAMWCAKNDYAVRDKRTPHAPATVWLGDRFECPGCGASIVTGFGGGRVEDHTTPDALEFRRSTTEVQSGR